MKKTSTGFLLAAITLVIVLSILRYSGPDESPLDDLLIKAKKSLSQEHEDSLSILVEGTAKSDFWEHHNQKALAGIYAFQTANSLNDWLRSGDLLMAGYYQGFRDSLSEDMQNYLVVSAEKSYSKVLELEPDHIEAKIRLADCYTQGLGQIMPGVQTLLSVLEQDSLNVPANLRLGRFSLMSGQQEKAVVRFQNVLATDSTNREAHLSLGRIYLGTNRPEDALEYLEKAKAFTVEPKELEELETLIKKIKNN